MDKGKISREKWWEDEDLWEWMLNQAKRIARDEYEARQVRQEAAFKISQSPGIEFNKTYVRMTLKSCLLSIRDQEERLKQALAKFAAFSLDEEDSSKTVVDNIANHEIWVRFAKEITTLPPRQKEVSELYLLRNLSHSEIAEVLGISFDASKKAWHDACKKLRILAEELGLL